MVLLFVVDLNFFSNGQNYYFGSKVKVKTVLSFALFFLIFANSFLCG